MRNLLRAISWWKLMVGGGLTFAELHYFAFPLMRAGELRTPAGEWLNLLAQVFLFAFGVWMMWSATAPRRGHVQSRHDPSLLLFSGGSLVEYLFLRLWIPLPNWVNPLDRPALTLAYSVMNIGSEPGRGWDMAIPPLVNQIGWWAVILGVFGLECMVVGKMFQWLWQTLTGSDHRTRGRWLPGARDRRIRHQ